MKYFRNRRSSVACLVALTASLTAAVLGAAPRPNLLLILADDLGFSDLGCYGSEIKTPVLDGLAANGLRLTQFYNSARCCPSRASLMTGLYPHQAGLGNMTADEGAEFPGYRGRINQQCVTLGEVLQSAGYRTLAAGKWHVGDFDPTTRGFDDFYGWYRGYGVDSWNERMMIRLPAGRPQRHYEPGKFYATDAITDHALDFLAAARQESGKPWFLYLAYQAPHFPLQAPAEEIAKYEKVYAQGWDKIREQRLARMKQLGLVPATMSLTPRSRIPLPALARQHGLPAGLDVNPAWDSLDPERRADLARRMAVFAAMVDRMDSNIGRVIADLRAHRELDNTFVVFLSDNGACAEWDPYGFDLTLPPPEKAEPGTGVNAGTQNAPSVLHRGEELQRLGGPGSYIAYGSAWANAGNAPLRLYKHYAHEGGICTPFIMHWPAGIKRPGSIDTRAVGHLIDVMPTFVELAGAQYPAQHSGHAILPMEGVSLVPLSRGAPLARTNWLCWEHEGNRAVRDGQWKLVGFGGGAGWELYDIVADRGEQNNLAGQYPNRVKAMAAYWEDWAKRCLVVPRKGSKGR